MDDWKKFGRVVQYVRVTIHLPLIFGSDSTGNMIWSINASLEVYIDMKNHTGYCFFEWYWFCLSFLSSNTIIDSVREFCIINNLQSNFLPLHPSWVKVQFVFEFLFRMVYIILLSELSSTSPLISPRTPYSHHQHLYYLLGQLLGHHLYLEVGICSIGFSGLLLDWLVVMQWALVQLTVPMNLLMVHYHLSQSFLEWIGHFGFDCWRRHWLDRPVDWLCFVGCWCITRVHQFDLPSSWLYFVAWHCLPLHFLVGF